MRIMAQVVISPLHRTLFYIFLLEIPYSVLMRDLLTTDSQFLSSARMCKLPP